MPRSVKKGPYVDENLATVVEEAANSRSKKVIKSWSRRSVIVPNMIGLTFAVHNGKKFVPIFVTENMIGHKFGEFAATRIFKGHSGIKKEMAGAPAGAPSAAGAVAPSAGAAPVAGAVAKPAAAPASAPAVAKPAAK